MNELNIKSIIVKKFKPDSKSSSSNVFMSKLLNPYFVTLIYQKEMLIIKLACHKLTN